jgi:hypothetical protein
MDGLTMDIKINDLDEEWVCHGVFGPWTPDAPSELV